MRRLLTTTALVALISAPAIAGSDAVRPAELAQAGQPADTPSVQDRQAPATAPLGSSGSTGTDVAPPPPPPSPEEVFLRDKRQVGLDNITVGAMIGAPSYTADKQSVGEISDIVLTTDGRLQSAIVDVGGFLGIGEKPVEIGFDDLEVYRDDGGDLHIVTPFTEAQLDQIAAYVPQSKKPGGANSVTPEG